MNKIVILMISGFLITHGLFAQTDGFSGIITEIEKNNKQLQAFQGYLDNRHFVNQTMNNIDDLEVTGAYLPFGNHNTPNYVEVRVAQSFEFPSAYRARSEFIEQDKRQQEIAYLKTRQQIVAQVSDLHTQITYQQKRKAVELTRTQQARKVYEQIAELYDKEAIGKLDLNKAKIAWLQQQFAIDGIGAEIDRLLTELRGLNGGMDISVPGSEYSGSLALAALDSLWKDKQYTDPFLRFREESEKTALANITVQKKERLPEFDFGLNYEGVKGENYAGFSGGLFIPIWNRKNTVKAAEAQYIYEQKQTDAVTSALFAEYAGWYQQYGYLLSKYNEYLQSINLIDGEELLAKAHELGELSYLEYYMELKFYQDAYDELIAMEQELYLLRNKLLKHNL